MARFGSLISFTALVCLLNGSTGLRLLSYSIPSIVDFRDEAVLSCEFDPEQERIESVKWSVNGTTFFTHNAYGKFVNFVDGVSVRAEKSNMNTVVLAPLYFSTSGLYRCEATTLSPTPNTLAIHRTMNIVALPQAGPSIEGIQPSHTWGDEIELNCTSAPSYPAAAVMWTIRDIPVRDDQVKVYYDAREAEELISRTKTGVRLLTSDLPFDGDNELSINCIAVVPGIYRNIVTLKIAKAQRVN